jgi:hypothetical protein
LKLWELQEALHAKAKGNPGYRFYALYDKVCRLDVLAEAWRKCHANGGVAGVDGVRFEDIEAQGVAEWLGQLATIADTGCASGCATNTKCKGAGPATIPTSIYMSDSGWCGWKRRPATSRGRKHESTLVRKPDAGKPHVRFDERGVEPERSSCRYRATPRLYYPLGLEAEQPLRSE